MDRRHFLELIVGAAVMAASPVPIPLDVVKTPEAALGQNSALATTSRGIEGCNCCDCAGSDRTSDLVSSISSGPLSPMGRIDEHTMFMFYAG